RLSPVSRQPGALNQLTGSRLRQQWRKYCMNVVGHDAERIQSIDCAVAMEQRFRNDFANAVVLQPNRTCYIRVEQCFKLTEPAALKQQSLPGISVRVARQPDSLLPGVVVTPRVSSLSATAHELI